MRVTRERQEKDENCQENRENVVPSFPTNDAILTQSRYLADNFTVDGKNRPMTEKLCMYLNVSSMQKTAQRKPAGPA
jgi:hypothetical protein